MDPLTLLSGAQLLVRVLALPAALFAVTAAWRARPVGYRKAAPGLVLVFLTAGLAPLLDEYSHGQAHGLQTVVEAMLVLAFTSVGAQLMAVPVPVSLPCPPLDDVASPDEATRFPSTYSAADQWLAALWDSAVLVTLVDKNGRVHGHIGGTLRQYPQGSAAKGAMLPESDARRQRLNQALQHRVCFHQEYAGRRFIVTGQPWYDPVGEPRGAVFIAVDVTDKDAEP